MNDTIQIFDNATGETIVREMTNDEQTIRDAEVAEALLRKEAKAQTQIENETKRQALLNKLGITEDEAQLLLGGN
jgi:2-hydroxychromene-2-carboxylate isomerase